MQSQFAAEPSTYLEYFKAINVQHADVKLLMIFHHGFVDGLKSNDCNCHCN